MTAAKLLAESKKALPETGDIPPNLRPTQLFAEGARWMHHQMSQTLGMRLPAFNPNTRYNCYGWLKYGTCLLAFLFSAFLLGSVHFLLIPLSILVFYFFEVQFLFLFPLLLLQEKEPIRQSLRMTRKIRVWKAIFVVIPIAAFMLLGLFRQQNRFYHWQIGCLAILIWYRYEMGIRS